MPPDGRFLVAFDDPTLTWSPTWTRLDSHDSLVTSYQIDRGRQYELDQTDTGRATVQIADQEGLLDPTNSTGLYYNKLEPLKQAMIGRRNPMSGVWYTRFRGFIENYDYSFHPSQRVNMLTVSLVDLFEVLAAIEMQPGQVGFPPPEGHAAEVFFEDQSMQDRVATILGSTAGVGIPADWSVIFSGNVDVWETAYSAGENVLTVIQDAANAEFPGVSNVFCDARGRICVHGRFAKFDPVGVASGTTTDQWEYHQWKVGDGDAVLAGPPMAQLRRFAFNRGLAKVINQATATPIGAGTDRHQPTADEIAAQVVTDTTSVGLYGIRSWSANNLLTKASRVPGVAPDPLAETKRFAEYYKTNYSHPQNRVTDIAFRSNRPAAPGAGELWDLLSRVDIADSVDVTITSPGGGGFNLEPFFVEGVHETVQPLNQDYDDVTLTLDLSPQAYFDNLTMFPEM